MLPTNPASGSPEHDAATEILETSPSKLVPGLGDGASASCHFSRGGPGGLAAGGGGWKPASSRSSRSAGEGSRTPLAPARIARIAGTNSSSLITPLPSQSAWWKTASEACRERIQVRG